MYSKKLANKASLERSSEDLSITETESLLNWCEERIDGLNANEGTANDSFSEEFANIDGFIQSSPLKAVLFLKDVKLANTRFHHSLCIPHNSDILHQLTSLKSRNAFQVARKILPCNMAFRRSLPIQTKQHAAVQVCTKGYR